MRRKKVKLKLKKEVINILKIIGVICAIMLIVYFIYLGQLSNFTELGYSKEASKEILFSGNKEFVLTIGENKTLNRAFESGYEDKYLSNYTKIIFQDHENLIKNINSLLDKGYSNNDVSIILAHGDDEEVTRFTKRDRIKYLEEFYQYSYAKLDNYDRYISYTDETGEDEITTVIHVNLGMDKEEYTDSEEVTVFGADMLINKYRYVGEYFIPNDLMLIDKKYTADEDVHGSRIAVNALVQMFESANIDGLKLVVNSGYRSYEDQVEITEFYRKWYGDKYVEANLSRPGFSEHHTGLAFDVGSATESTFIESKEYEWMKENAYKYGFIARFTKRGESITGFRSEPWHYRYVGKDIAKYIYENNITFEEYYVMFLDK